ncbi:MAG: hypothetical protein AAFU70_14215, partial [Planctomycetota bacterium]
MTTMSSDPASETQTTPNGEFVRHAIMEELDFPTDPNNLYSQCVSHMLRAADLIDLKHRVRIILAQPKNEVMVHFPVRMDDGHHRLFKGYR